MAAACVMAAAQDYMFKRLGVKEGLPNNKVNAIYKDSKGFMWFATDSGLARYDGYRFKVFYSDEADSTSLPESFVDRIVEDRDGRLWICTSMGYTYFDRTTETFRRDMPDYMRTLGMEWTPNYVYVDKQGDPWFYLNGKGCYRYDSETAEAQAVTFEKGVPGSCITSMAECDEGILLAYDNGQVICLDKEKRTVRWTLDSVCGECRNRTSDVFSLYVDSEGDLWIYGVPGVWVYNIAQKSWHTEWNDGRQPWTGKLVRTIEQDRYGRIWLGEDLEGVSVWDKQSGQCVQLCNRPEDERSLPNNNVIALYRDNDGIIWVGTGKKGVACYSENIYKFGQYDLGDVNYIEEDGKGNLWLGLNDEGLLHWNPQTGEKRRYTTQDGLASNAIVSLLRAHDGKLWIGTFLGGLDCYDGQRFTHYRHRGGDAASLASENVWSLAEDRNGNIWIGTLGGGIQCLEPKTGRFTNYNVANSGLASDHIASICFARDGKLIVGTASSGVSLLDPVTGKATNLNGTTTGDVRFPNQGINQVFEDRRGLWWIGTRDGLNVYDPFTDRLRILSSDNEVPVGRFIAGISEDKEGGVWVMTANEVIHVQVDMDSKSRECSFRYNLYDDKDGLQSNLFNQRAIKRLASGSIVMGGLDGINSFIPGQIKDNDILPKVIFTGFRLFNEDVEVGKMYKGRVVLEKALCCVDEVVLDYCQNVFSVFFASDNYVLPEKTCYTYKLEGFDSDWMTSASDIHRATYTNLMPGTYRLKVKAVNSGGYAGTEEAVLRIVIRPPFWMTTWAYLGYGLAMLALLWGVYRWIGRREQRKFRLRQQEEEARKKEEFNQMKFRFFTNVSHELRTPLTLIISPLETLMKSTADGKQLDRLRLMHRNAMRLLNLVNQLLDFRKLEMAGMKLSFSEGDIVLFVRNICNSFLMLSEKKNVHLTFFSSLESLNISFDEDKIGKVMMNLLANAFKFTPEGGRVDVSIQLMEGMSDMLSIRVADSGIGVSDADKAHIFERFYQVAGSDSHSTGSGIGLSLVHDFVTLHGGTVHVVDNVGAGSVFVVQLPIKQTGTAPVAVQKENGREELTPDEAASSSPAVATETVAEEAEGKLKKPLALVVDDNADLVEFMKDALSVYFRVEAAANGTQAWERIPQIMPDIIVSDIMMEGMDGNELCRLVKTDKRTEAIPLILLTAKQTLEAKVEGLTMGADDYVTKPFNVEVLILRMRKLVELSRKTQPRTHIEPEPSRIAITSLDEQLVANAIKYVEQNIDRSDLSVEELSQALNMSRVHLYKKLSQITGKTPIEFIRIIRLKRAAQLLRESQLNVSEIAYQVGFNNPKYFTRYFKEEFGVLPSVYQEKEGR